MKKAKNADKLEVITFEMYNRSINRTIEKTVAVALNELKKQQLIKTNSFTAFQKTEHLLYNYKNFLAAIDDKFEQIENIAMVGVPSKSKSITSFGGLGSGKVDVESEIEKVEEKIEALQSSILLTRKYIGVINNALDKIKDDPYYKVIEMKYFEGCSREKIADDFEVDVSTITRNKNRLINVLKIYLFSDEVIMELFS